MNPHTITTVKCAICEKIKQASNHWFVARIFRGEFIVSKFAMATLEYAGTVPLCGQGCSQRYLEIWMTHQRNSEAPDQAFYDFQVSRERHEHSTDSSVSMERFLDQGVGK